MRNTERRPRTFSEIGIRVVLLVLAAVLLMALQISGNLRPVQSLVTQLTAPAQLSATGVTSGVSDLFGSLLRIRTLEQDLARRDLTINAMALAEDGSISEVSIAVSSGHPILDKAAVRAAYAMARVNWAHSRELILPFVFRLE